MSAGKPLPMSSLAFELADELKRAGDKEDFFNRLRRFKRAKLEIIAHLESDPLANRRAILARLSELAETVIKAAYLHVADDMPNELGIPCYLAGYKQLCPAELAVVGMGKLGSREMNYESDVDLTFIYSRIGESNGKKSVSNGEYFVMFAQRLINVLNVLTEAGRCYSIDVELRPSGNAGPLVTSFDHFLDHQMNKSESWERMAIMRARPVVLPDNFGLPLARHFDDLRFNRPLPENFFPVMHAIRGRVIQERAREDRGRIDLKYGPGSLMDIEFILHGLALKCHAVYPELRTGSLFELLSAIATRELLSAHETAMLTDAYVLYRTLESRLHLARHRAEHVLVTDGEDFAELSRGLDLGGPSALAKRLEGLRRGVREIYLRYYHAA